MPCDSLGIPIHRHHDWLDTFCQRVCGTPYAYKTQGVALRVWSYSEGLPRTSKGDPCQACCNHEWKVCCPCQSDAGHQVGRAAWYGEEPQWVHGDVGQGNNDITQGSQQIFATPWSAGIFWIENEARFPASNVVFIIANHVRCLYLFHHSIDPWSPSAFNTHQCWQRQVRYLLWIQIEREGD